MDTEDIPEGRSNPASAEILENETQEETDGEEKAKSSEGGEGLLHVPGNEEEDAAIYLNARGTSGRRRSLKDAANILKREALKQYLQQEGIEGEEAGKKHER